MKLFATYRIGLLAAACGGFLLCLFGPGVQKANADAWDKKTVLTVNQPIQVEETYLEPGTYVFKLLNSSSDRHIVQIFNQDQNRVINTILAVPNYRLQPTADSRFTFYETPPGTAPAMHAWFYPGDDYGQEFRYPKQLRQLATAWTPQRLPFVEREPLTPAAPAPSATPVSPAQDPEETPAAPAETPKPQPPAPVEREPEMIARATPPDPAPAEPEPQSPAPAAGAAPAPQSQELPKTGTPFPLIGTAGLGSLALLALVRLVRSNV